MRRRRGGKRQKHTHTRTHTHTHSCLFATAAFKAVMTGQRVIRDSEWRGHYSCSPLPANNCNYPNSTLTTIDLSLSLRPRPPLPSPPSPPSPSAYPPACVYVCLSSLTGWRRSASLSARELFTPAAGRCGERRQGPGQIRDSRKTQILVQLPALPSHCVLSVTSVSACAGVCVCVYVCALMSVTPGFGGHAHSLAPTHTHTVLMCVCVCECFPSNVLTRRVKWFLKPNWLVLSC